RPDRRQRRRNPRALPSPPMGARLRSAPELSPRTAAKDRLVTSITSPRRATPLERVRALPRITGLRRARADEPTWVLPAQVGVIALAAVVDLINLTVSGFANTYYSAAAPAASHYWSAWFFVAFDAANFIRVDKPPLGTMLMGLSGRMFGLRFWSILLPEGLGGVATV